MQAYFHELADFLYSRLKGKEVFTCWFSAEASDFVRFNQGAIRQPGQVRQCFLTVTLIDGLRQAKSTTTITGNPSTDYEILARSIDELRTQLEFLPDDPHLLIAQDICSTEQISVSRLPDTGTLVADIQAYAKTYDFVGFLAAGPIYRGFANSYGQRNWHESTSFNLELSLYHAKDKAVKASCAGLDWDKNKFNDKFHETAAQLELFKQKSISLKPGNYRAYLAPAALKDIIDLLNWGGFSEKALRTKQSPLGRMRDEGATLHSMVSLSEDLTNGLMPAFQTEGFIKPETINLINQGCLAGSLISPRSAKEFTLDPNGANGYETQQSTSIEAGNLPIDKILTELDTGLYISNLWYLNYSDRMHGRMTGMTRFATFWVENGQIKAPLEVMRFDDSVYRLLGENLLALTTERELFIENESYGQRSTTNCCLPGALISSLSLVL